MDGRARSAYLLTRINPFLPEALGARAPDTYGYPTGSAVLRNSYTVPSSASGNFAVAYSGDPIGPQYNPLTAGASVNWVGGSYTVNSQSTPLRAIAKVVRVVGWGLRITTDLPITSAAGHIWVAHLPYDDADTVANNYPSTEQQFANCPLAEKFSLVELAERPLIVTARPVDDGINRFRSIVQLWQQNGASAVESTTGWASIVIYGAGLPPSVASMNIEIIQHVEYVQNGSTLYGFVDALMQPHDESMLEAATIISQTTPIAQIETGIDTAAKAIDSATRAVFAGGRLVNAIVSAATVGRRMLKSASPFKSIGW